jgi:hypothetical protein
MNHELKKELNLKFNYLGDSEILLGYSKAATKDVNTIAELIDAHRKRFEQGRIANIGSAVFATAEVWQAIAAESDRAARSELLASSPELAQLSDLEAKALAAKQAAEAKERELQALWSEFQALPVKADAINLRLAQISNDLRSLDVEKLAEDWKATYRSILGGGRIFPETLTELAMTMYTADLRREVLTKLADALEVELAELRKRNRQLCKQLGVKQDI